MEDMKRALFGLLLAVALILAVTPSEAQPSFEVSPSLEPIIRGVPWISQGEVCPSCSIFTDSPFFSSSLKESEKLVSTSMGVINASGVRPVEGATLFVYVLDSERNDLLPMGCRMLTSGLGSADFSYDGLDCDDGCTVKMYFCCANPDKFACVLEPCLGRPVEAYTDVPPCGEYAGTPWPAGGATVGGAEMQLYPAYDEVVIPPKPKDIAIPIEFGFCLPVLLIFGLLGGAMYASGRDPFAMFSFYTPRYTRGHERPIGGKGYSFSGSGIMLAAQTIKKAATGELGKELSQQAQYAADTRSALGIGEGRAVRGKGGGQVDRSGAGAEAQQARSEARQAGAQSAVAPAVLRAPPSNDRIGDQWGSGMDALRLLGANVMSLLGYVLRTSSVQWAVGGLAEAAYGVAQKWTQERQESFITNSLPQIVQSMRVTFNAQGQTDSVTYTDPRDGQTHTVRGVDECRELLGEVVGYIGIADSNVRGQMLGHITGLMESSHRERLDSAANSRSVLNDEMARVQEQLTDPTVTGTRRDQLTDVLSALTVLTSETSTQEQRAAAFQAIYSMGGDAASMDMKLNAFTAATAGMSYEAMAAFVSGSPAAHQMITWLADRDAETGAGSMMYSQLADHDGNMRAAVALALGNLEVIASTRAEGAEDTLRLGGAIGAMQGGLRDTADIGFGYRSGTNENLANEIVAMGLSSSALGMTVDLEHFGIAVEMLPEDVRAEVQAALADGAVQVSELSNEARQAIISQTGLEALEAGPLVGEAEGAGLARAEQMQELFGQYDGIGRQVYGLERSVASEGLEAVDRMLSGVTPIVGPNGELMAMGMPERLYGAQVAEALREHGVTAGDATALYAIDNLMAQEQAIGAMNELMLRTDLSAYAAAMAGRVEAQQERMVEYSQQMGVAISTLASPGQASEGTLNWARDLVAGEVAGMFVPPDATPEQRQEAAVGISEMLRSASPEEMEQYSSIARQNVDATTSYYSDERAQQFTRAANIIATPNQETAVAWSTTAEQERALAAVETLRTSTDEQARLDAPRTLEQIGIPQNQMDPLLGRYGETGATPGSPYAQQLTDTGAASAVETVNAYYERERTAPSHTPNIQDVLSEAVGLVHDEIYAPPAGGGQSQFERQLSETQTATEEAQRAGRHYTEMQPLFMDDQQVREFYANMGRAREVAEAAAQVAAEHTAETRLGMPYWTEPGAGSHWRPPGAGTGSTEMVPPA